MEAEYQHGPGQVRISFLCPLHQLPNNTATMQNGEPEMWMEKVRNDGESGQWQDLL